MVKITKSMTIAEVMNKHPKAAEIFQKHGLYCCFCPMAAQETLEEAAKVHGLDLKTLLEELNK